MDWYNFYRDVCAQWFLDASRCRIVALNIGPKVKPSPVFFTGSHLKLHEIVKISYWWASETSVSKTIQQTGHSSRTIMDWCIFHRDVCAQ